MRRPDSFAAVATRLIDTYKGEFTTLSLWVTSVGFFGMAYAVTGRRTIEDYEVVVFTAAFALASATATVTALVVAGRARWALGAAVCFTAFAMAAAGVAVWLAWVFRPPAPPFRQPISAGEIAEAAIVAGLLLGVGIGLIAGLVILLARRWPRLVGWLTAGILVVCVARYAHISVFDHIARQAMKARVGLFADRVQLPAATGAGAGAIVGVSAVGTVLWWIGRRPTAGGLDQPRPAGPDSSSAEAITS
jgi:hypothetical protein